MSKRDENKRAMEEHIYDVALNLFCEDGYKETTLIDIAQEADVSTRTLYNYFPTKESLLQKFTQENLCALESYASDLPENISLKERVLTTMVYDFDLMFALFDVSYLLDTAGGKGDRRSRFEMGNILTAETIYRKMFEKERLRKDLKPNNMPAICASIIMAIYRHCNDLYRFRFGGTLDKDMLESLYRSHIDTIWSSLVKTLCSMDPPSSCIDIDKRLFTA